LSVCDNVNVSEVRALRERRRLQTAYEVSDAALALFERDGVEATRVEDIAAAAGISPRTFFRYFPSKEHAAFATDPDVEAVVDDAVAGLRPDRPLLPQLEAMQRAALDVLARAEGEAGGRSLRLWRLIEAEPALAAVAAGLRNERACTFADRVRGAYAGALDELELDLALGVWQATTKSAFASWAADVATGEPAPLREHYERAVALLRGLGAG
jgi:AcrR family transcriptional regulator